MQFAAPTPHPEKLTGWRPSSTSTVAARSTGGGVCLRFPDLDPMNQDLDENPPQPWEALRQSIRSASAVLFITPEYNRSVPGVLKNAIDIASRPYGHSVFDAKPAAIVSHSPGAVGGFGANHALRQSLSFLNMPTLPQPEVYLANVASMFDDAGTLTDASARGFLTTFMTTFAAWIGKHAATGSG